VGASGARAQRERSRSASGWPGRSGAEGGLECSAGLSSGTEAAPARSKAGPVDSLPLGLLALGEQREALRRYLASARSAEAVTRAERPAAN